MTISGAAYSVMEEAWRLRRLAITRSRSVDLDPKTAMWILTEAGWRQLRTELAPTETLEIRCRPGKSLFGLPVRISYDDPPDTPMIQLVMEPMLFQGDTS